MGITQHAQSWRQAVVMQALVDGAKVLTNFPDGTEIEVLQELGHRYYIRAVKPPNSQGWVRTEHVRIRRTVEVGMTPQEERRERSRQLADIVAGEAPPPPPLQEERRERSWPPPPPPPPQPIVTDAVRRADDVAAAASRNRWWSGRAASVAAEMWKVERVPRRAQSPPPKPRRCESASQCGEWSKLTHTERLAGSHRVGPQPKHPPGLEGDGR